MLFHVFCFKPFLFEGRNQFQMITKRLFDLQHVIEFLIKKLLTGEQSKTGIDTNLKSLIILFSGQIIIIEVSEHA